MIRVEANREPNTGKWRITLDDGGPIGSRLKKGADWPSYPLEVDTEEDAQFYKDAWEFWINDQNKELKRYVKKK